MWKSNAQEFIETADGLAWVWGKSLVEMSIQIHN